MVVKTIIGIDPGLEGAVTEISPESLIRSFDTPFLATQNAKGKDRRVYNEVEMANILKRIVDEAPGHGASGCLAVIEQVHSMPKQGVASSFTFGMGYGIWLGILAALQIPSLRVTPQRWKKEVMQDGPKTDQAVIAFAGRLYPACMPLMTTPRGKLLLGRADALLIAHWGRLQMAASA